MNLLLTPLRTRVGLLIGMTLVVVALGDNLLYRQPIGINLTLVGGALLLLLAVRRLRSRPAMPQGAVGLAVVGLLAAQCYRFSVLAAMLTGLGLITLALVSRHGWTGNVEIWAGRWRRFIPSALAQPFRDRALARRWRDRHPRFIRITRMMVIRFCLPLVLGSLFVSLFALANPVLANWLSDALASLWDLLCRLVTLPPFSRLLLWCVLLVFAWALCRTRGHRRVARRRASPSGPLPPPLPPPLHPACGPDVPPEPVLNARLLTNCLLLFNALFAVQNLLDTRYLWGGAVLPQGLTWAQYAHRGAYPLVVTALLAGVFILWAFHPDCRAGDTAGPRRLLILWVAQNVFLTFSALWRLDLYVQVYSLTLWRVAAAIWMGLVITGLLWTLWRILRNRGNTWLINANVYTLAVVLYACCFIDWEGVIAAYNVGHCREAGASGQVLDTVYLQGLGTGTLPALCAFRATPGAQESAATRAKLDQTITILKHQLREQNRDWRGWTWQRQRLNGVL